MDITEKIHEIEKGILQIKASQPIISYDLKYYVHILESPYLWDGRVGYVIVNFQPQNDQPCVAMVYGAAGLVAPATRNCWYVEQIDNGEQANANLIYCVSTQPGSWQQTFWSGGNYVPPGFEDYDDEDG